MSSKFKDDIYLFDNIKEEIQPKNLRKLLNLNFMKTANETRRVGEYDLPYILSSINMYPDFIALYGEFSKYKLTYRTCVAFYEYDQVFDGIKGIWNAIYHDIRKWQFYYLNRFAGVKYFIAPDYSLCGDLTNSPRLKQGDSGITNKR